MLNEFLSCGAVFRLQNGRLLVGCGLRTWLPEPRDLTKPHLYSPDFFLRASLPWFTHEEWHELSIPELLAIVTPQHLHPAPAITWQNPYEAHFARTFAELQQQFAAGTLRKAVPFVFANSPLKLTQQMLQRALISTLTYSLAQPNTYLYGHWDADSGMLGVTPEILFDLTNNGQTLHTMACAGTCRSETDRDRMLRDPKERQEHQLVVEGIKEALDPLGTVSVGSLTLLPLPGLAHLVTPISAHLHQAVSYPELVRALHPTPALGAFPREAGALWLRNYQTFIDRRRFGAPVGCIYDRGESSRCVVAIRNMQWDASGIAIGAGCGVVATSQLDKEWQEIQLKISATQNLLGLK